MMDKKQMLKSVEDYLSEFGKIGVGERKILDVINEVDRKNFVHKNLEAEAYVDEALSIGSGQTISQPSTVARMLQLLELKKDDKVLEIGAGSGWNASLIAKLVASGKVISTELREELAQQARQKIKKLSIINLEIVVQDFRKIAEKFDKIIFTAGISKSQEKTIEDFAETNLEDKGILVCPYQSGSLMLIRKIKDRITKAYTDEQYIFVPLAS